MSKRLCVCVCTDPCVGGEEKDALPAYRKPLWKKKENKATWST